MKNKNILLSIVFGLLFVVILILVVCSKTTNFDRAVYDIIISLRSPFFDTFFTTITKFGNTIMIVLIVSMFILITISLFSNLIMIVLIISILILMTRNRYFIFLSICVVESKNIKNLEKQVVTRE